MKATIVMLVSAGLALGQNNPQRAAQGRGAVTNAIEAGRKQPPGPRSPTIRFPQGPKLIGAPTGQPITNPGGGGTPDAVTGAASLASTGSVPVVASPGKLTAHQGLTYDGPTSTIKLGTGDDGIEIRPKNTETFGVLSVRSATANTPTAWDVFPNGTGQGGLGNRAWIDVCKEDLTTNP
ncbi:MAG: hypothetical protein AAB225_08285, partial [Acidobacteriota bacterium]